MTAFFFQNHLLVSANTLRRSCVPIFIAFPKVVQVDFMIYQWVLAYTYT